MHKSVADWLTRENDDDCEGKKKSCTKSLYKITEEDVRAAHRRMVRASHIHKINTSK